MEQHADQTNQEELDNLSDLEEFDVDTEELYDEEEVSKRR
jgi:hypothetical protein